MTVLSKQIGLAARFFTSEIFLDLLFKNQTDGKSKSFWSIFIKKYSDWLKNVSGLSDECKIQFMDPDLEVSKLHELLRNYSRQEKRSIISDFSKTFEQLTICYHI